MTDLPDNHWRWAAECNDKWQLFDQDDETGEYRFFREAKMFCDECPVRVECKIAGEGQPQGIWAGEIKGDNKR